VAFLAKLKENQVFISLRGEAIRVAVSVFNDKEDLYALVNILKSYLE
jgi:selenocysteine lyase/cysteine desulfurase